MAAHLTIRAERQLRAAIDHILRIRCVATTFVDDPTFRNGLSLPERYLDLAVGDCAGCHINDDGRLFVTGKSNGERVGAKHSLRAPERRDEFGRVGHVDYEFRWACMEARP